ncbi:MAG: hypothetical protein ACRESZ_23250 [Methylococcales bacterium]
MAASRLGVIPGDITTLEVDAIVAVETFPEWQSASTTFTVRVNQSEGI